VTAAAGLDHAARLRIGLHRSCGNGTRCLSGPAGLAHRIGKGQQVVLGGAWVNELRRKPDDLPAERDGLTLRMHGAQVIRVGLRVGCQRSQDCGLVGVDVGQRRDGAARAGSAGTLARQTHKWTVFPCNDLRHTPRRKVAP
jgi:hypothetical protein